MNSYLKEIADVTGIYIKLSFHTAKHTCYYYHHTYLWRVDGNSIKNAEVQVTKTNTVLCKSP